ncbi:MAG: DUF1178 family protein [Pseudomonadota bacterium]
MIRYQLICDEEHTFESWFANSAAFDSLSDLGEITCPICGSTQVRKAIMAPNVSPRTRQKSSDDAPRPASSTSSEVATIADSDAPVDVSNNSDAAAQVAQLVEAIRQVRDEVLAKSENVGSRFAEEARKIHFEEVEPRAIYGQATSEEARDLVEDGVDFYALPTLPEDRN